MDNEKGRPYAGFFAAFAIIKGERPGPVVWAGYATRVDGAFRSAWRAVKALGIPAASISMATFEPTEAGVRLAGLARAGN